MPRHTLPKAALACLLAVCAAPLAAQDPAAVGGNDDPAFVGARSGGGGGMRTSNELSFGELARAGENNPERAMNDVEALLGLVRDRLSGTGEAGARDADRGDAARFRHDAEILIRRNWNQLGPLTRDLYAAQYGRTDPNDGSQRYRSPYGDEGQPERAVLGGTDDPQQAMQNLEDLLLPMLQDLKRGFDTELRNRANSR